MFFALSFVPPFPGSNGEGYSYGGAADDSELAALLCGDKAAGGGKKPFVGLTGGKRNVKFMYYFVPIIRSYRKMQVK